MPAQPWVGCDRGRVALGRALVASSVGTQHVEIAIAVSTHSDIHALQIPVIRPRDAVIPGARGREAGADDHGVGVGGLDSSIGQFQHLDVGSGIGELSPPLTYQVGLVPHLVGANASPISACQGSQEIGKVLQVVGWSVGGESAASPGGLVVKAYDQIDPLMIGLLDDSVGARPVEGPLGRALDVAPAEADLAPGEARLADDLQVAAGHLRTPPKEGLHSILGRAHAQGLFRARARRQGGRRLGQRGGLRLGLGRRRGCQRGGPGRCRGLGRRHRGFGFRGPRGKRGSGGLAGPSALRRGFRV